MPDSLEIRAAVPVKVADRWRELADMLGTAKNTETMAAVINLLYLQFCSSRWHDMQAKAARLISTHKNFVTPMPAVEVKRLVIDAGGVQAYCRSQGEPYRISSELWEKG
ncbi:MAG: hypothetical protein AAGJ95_11890 [Cyanobacteria bacterium J06554_11]